MRAAYRRRVRAAPDALHAALTAGIDETAIAGQVAALPNQRS